MSKSKKVSTNFIPKVWRLLAPFKKDFYRILAITALFETIRLGGPYLFGKILDLLVRTKGILSLETALWVVGGLAGVRFLSILIDYITDYVIIKLLINIETHMSTRAFAKLLELSLDYHEKVHTGTKINIVNRGGDKLSQLVESYVFEFQPVVIQLTVTSILMILTSWTIGIIFTFSIFPFIFITFKIYQSTSLLRKRRHDAYEDSSDEIGDAITNITVVKAFAQETRENRSFGSIWGLIESISFTEVRRHLFTGFGRSILMEGFYAGMLVLGLFEIKAGRLTVGSLVFLITLTERAYSHIYRFGRIYERVMDAKEPVDRFTSLFSKSSSIKQAENPIKVEIEGQIAFRHVTFAYSKRRVLRNVTLTIPAGSFVALVGRSGSGKSTIAKLLSRYYDPTLGQIVLDGKYDLRNLDLDTYRAQTSVVFQDSPVPNRRIWEVISYSAGKKTFASVEKRVLHAAALAHAHEFILELDRGYQTLIGERGVKLSGGQRQRLAIARALFAEPKVLIMDEPTSHLDTMSEALIQKALEEMSREHSMTKIIIAHRLSTVQHADQIFVMERGRVVERGTHKKLLENGGVYADIVHQSELKQ